MNNNSEMICIKKRNFYMLGFTAAALVSVIVTVVIALPILSVVVL